MSLFSAYECVIVVAVKWSLDLYMENKSFSSVLNTMFFRDQVNPANGKEELYLHLRYNYFFIEVELQNTAAAAKHGDLTFPCCR